MLQPLLRRSKDKAGADLHPIAAAQDKAEHRPLFSPPLPGEITASPSYHSSLPRVTKALQLTPLSVTAAMDASSFPPKSTSVASTPDSISD